MSTRRIQGEQELAAIAREVLAVVSKKDEAHTLILSGDLGAGKTAFVKALAQVLSITEHVTSPTFVIMKSYAVENHPLITTLTHIDAYRIEDEDEMRVLGLPDILKQPGNLVCIEWPERISKSVPQGAYRVAILIHKDGSRTITYGE